MEILNEKYLFFCDLETSGLDPIRNDVVSLCIMVTDSEFNIMGTFYETCKPEFNKFYSEKAEEIHGFSRAELSGFQSRKKMLISLLHFLNEFRSPGQYHPFIYHALKGFDWKFVVNAFEKENMRWSFYKMFNWNFTESTVEMARNAGYIGNKLNEWADRMGFELDHHDARSDTECCLEVYKYLRRKHG